MDLDITTGYAKKGPRKEKNIPKIRKQQSSSPAKLSAKNQHSPSRQVRAQLGLGELTSVPDVSNGTSLDLISTSTSDLSAFINAHSEDFRIEALKQMVRTPGKSARKDLELGEGSSAAALELFDKDGNLVIKPADVKRRKSLDEFTYIYRAAKLEKNTPGYSVARQHHTARKVREERTGSQTKVNQDDLHVILASPSFRGSSRKSSPMRSPQPALHKRCQAQTGVKPQESAEERQSREKAIHDSLVRMFELQVKLESKRENESKANTIGGGTLSMFSPTKLGTFLFNSLSPFSPLPKKHKNLQENTHTEANDLAAGILQLHLPEDKGPTPEVLATSPQPPQARGTPSMSSAQRKRDKLKRLKTQATGLPTL